MEGGEEEEWGREEVRSKGCIPFFIDKKGEKKGAHMHQHTASSPRPPFQNPSPPLPKILDSPFLGDGGTDGVFEVGLR